MGIADLSALTGMPLTELFIDNNAITDLSPLKGMALTQLVCLYNAITDLSPLQQAPLHVLDCRQNAIGELAPLAGMALRELYCSHNRITDLSPLTVSSLKLLECNDNFISDLAPLRGAPLRELQCGGNAINDLSPLRGMRLSSLCCWCNNIHDLTPLAGMPLESLRCNGNPIVDLTPLRGMPLTRLDICGLVWNNTTGVVLSSLALEHLWCDISAPALAGIAGMPTLLAVNDHHVDYVRALLPHIAHALAIWRASAAPAPAEIVDALRSHATLLGESSCLSVPCLMTWEVANAFARWLGGDLACPLNQQESRQFMAYFEAVTLLRAYHIWYVIDPDTEVIAQMPGAAYAREMLAESEPATPREGRRLPACWVGINELLSVTRPEHSCYAAITWRKGPARAMASIPELAMCESHGAAEPGKSVPRLRTAEIQSATTQDAVTPSVTPPVRTEIARLLCTCSRTSSQRELMAMLGMSDKKHFRLAYLTPALAAGYLERTIPDKPHSNRQRYRLTESGQAWVTASTLRESCGAPAPRSTMPIPPSPDALSTAPSEHTLSAHDTAHDSLELARLISNCTGEQSMREIMAQLGLHHRQHFMNAYLRPALAAGYVERTIPDKPRSKRQHYRLTAKGLALKRVKGEE